MEESEDDKRDDRDAGADQQLKAEHVPHAVRILFPGELRAEDAGAGEPAEDGQIEYEDQLVRDRDAAHLLGSDPADHQIVQDVDELADAVLDHDGNDDRKDRLIKRFIPDVSGKKRPLFHSLKFSAGRSSARSSFSIP